MVLIVDDVPDNLAVLHDAWMNRVSPALVATNGRVRWREARQSLPDVILSRRGDARHGRIRSRSPAQGRPYDTADSDPLRDRG